MIDVTNIKIDDFYGIKFLYITFNVSELTEPEENYRFDLYRSVNQSDLFECIASDVKDFRYKDENVNLRNLNISYYYKIKATEKSTGNVSWSEIFRYDAHTIDEWAMAIIEIEEKYLRDVVNNEPAFVLQKKRTGERCSCYNPNRDAIDNDFCTECYGTAFKGGYYTPQGILINFYNNPSYSHEYTPKDDSDRLGDIQAWVPNFPRIETEDIIVHGDIRYIVTAKNDTDKNGYIIRQILTLSPLPKTNLVYQFEINVGGK